MAAVAGRSLVGRLALVTGKLLFCDANRVSLRISKRRTKEHFYFHCRQLKEYTRNIIVNLDRTKLLVKLCVKQHRKSLF